MEKLKIYKLLRLLSLIFIVFLVALCVKLYIDTTAYKEIIKDIYHLEDDSTAEIIKEQRIKILKEDENLTKPFKERLINGWR